MKYLFVSLALYFCSGNGNAQSTAQLQDSAKTLLQQGAFDMSVRLLELAREKAPKNVAVLKDLSFACYLKKDFNRAIEVGKEAIENPETDAQAYQVLGLSYKALALYKDGEKMYQSGLKKFPSSGVIYNEYGECLAMDDDMDAAIGQWEKGILSDPGYNVNYYNASMYYVRTNNWLRIIVYGELFVNLESFTNRTEEVKGEILSAYRALFSTGHIRALLNAKTTTPFEKSILEVFAKTTGFAKDGIDMDNISGIRNRFLAAWMENDAKTYPFRLFDHQQYLAKQGLFEAYNQWLFGEASNAAAYRVWQNAHQKEAEAFTTFQQSRVFKIPTGQYYFSK